METTSLKGLIPQSPIKSQTIHFLYGKLATDKNIFDTMSSLEIVQSAFGVESTNPSAVDVTEAIVKNLDSAEQIKLRTKINNPMEVGELWYFTTPKMFMILLSKVPLGNNTHELTLTLITKFEGSTDTGTEICSRHLATIGSGNVRFMSPRLRHIEFNASSVEFLQKIHDEAVANLKTNIEKSESEFKTTPPEDPNPVVISKEEIVIFRKGDRTDMVVLCRNNEQKDAIATMYDSGYHILLDNKMLGANQSIRDIRKSELDTRELDEIWDCFNHIDTPLNSQDYNPVPVTEKFNVISFNHRDLISIVGVDGGYVSIANLNNEELVVVHVPNFESKYKLGTYVATWCGDNIKLVDGDIKTIDLLMSCLSPLALKRGAIVFFEKGKEPNEVLITRRAPEGYSDSLSSDVKFDRGFIDPNVGPNFMYGYYHLNTNLCEQDFQFSEIDDFMSKFTVLQFPPIPPITEKEVETINQIAKEIKEEEEKETTEMPTDIQIKIDPGFVDIEENLCQMIKEYVTENPGASDDQITTHVRSCTEIDEIKVQCVDGVWTVAHEPVETKEEQETVSTVDIRDVNIQNSLLRGLFGVADPAITHVQKFLRNHLTSEGNAGFLATGSFPTETVIVYTEKPYDLTIAIVRFKDGRFYRIFGCQTALGLTDHGYIATKDMPGRWVKFGRDIQDVSYRGEQRRRY